MKLPLTDMNRFIYITFFKKLSNDFSAFLVNWENLINYTQKTYPELIVLKLNCKADNKSMCFVYSEWQSKESLENFLLSQEYALFIKETKV